ncbi:MAG: hypothetical protein RMK84_07305 [Oscillochloridaceae bacterium]|nr:hypothetical protein [Chloroflexaceae bacterium]MDW8389915.1 hypothetical protein [Oscillochloridaceae bacterium]
MADKYGSPSGSYSWLPDFVRKWLNLDEELPDYGPGADVSVPLAPPPARPALAYGAATPRSSGAPAPGYGPAATPRSSGAPAPGYGPAATPGYAPQPGYTPARPTYTPSTPTYTPPGEPGAYRAFAASGSYEPSAPPPPAPRPETSPPGAPLPAVGGVVQPIGYLIRSYIRGALPPQGLEQFTREVRTTFTDVWKFYSYWTRFQTEELFHMARELTDAVLGGRGRGIEGGNGGRDQPRRIRVTTTNDSDETKKAAQVYTPPPPSSAPPSPATSTATPAVASAAQAAEKTAARAGEQAGEKAAQAAEKTAESAARAAEQAAQAVEKTGEKAAQAAEKAAQAAKKAADETSKQG